MSMYLHGRTVSTDGVGHEMEVLYEGCKRRGGGVVRAGYFLRLILYI